MALDVHAAQLILEGFVHGVVGEVEASITQVEGIYPKRNILERCNLLVGGDGHTLFDVVHVVGNELGCGLYRDFGLAIEEQVEVRGAVVSHNELREVVGSVQRA